MNVIEVRCSKKDVIELKQVVFDLMKSNEDIFTLRLKDDSHIFHFNLVYDPIVFAEYKEDELFFITKLHKVTISVELED